MQMFTHHPKPECDVHLMCMRPTWKQHKRLAKITEHAVTQTEAKNV